MRVDWVTKMHVAYDYGEQEAKNHVLYIRSALYAKTQHICILNQAWIICFVHAYHHQRPIANRNTTNTHISITSPRRKKKDTQQNETNAHTFGLRERIPNK